jgi:hypothetical protein
MNDPEQSPEQPEVIAPAAGSGPLTGVFNEAQLASELSLRLVGKIADGSSGPTFATGRLQRVIWVDAGSEALVHLDSVRVKIADRMILISIDLETDQTGRTALVTVFAVGGPGDPVGLLAVTDELPRGNGLLAARWGSAVRNACWAALLSLLNDVAAGRHLAPIGIAAVAGSAQFVAGQPIVIPSGTLTPRPLPGGTLTPGPTIQKE